MTPAKGKEGVRLRLQSLDDHVVRLGPRVLHVDVTNGCNTDCITCWDHSPHLQEARPSAWKRQRLDADFLAALLDDVATLGGFENVILSGMGEPFTHPQIDAMMAAVKSRGLHLTIITNLVAADPERILALEVDQLLIGIHGASLESYLAFHPSFGQVHWERLHQRLACFQAAGRRYKHVQVICATNAHELTEMIELGARYDAQQVNFKLASLRRGTEAVGLDEDQRARLLEVDLARATARATALGVAHNLEVFRAQLETGGRATAPIDEVGCFLGFEYSRVTVEGTVLYCCNTEVVVGQLANPREFSDLWRGDAWQSMRARLRRGDYFSGCWQCGKLNENVKLSRQFRRAFGDERWNAARGMSDAEPRTRSEGVGPRDALRRLPVMP